MTKAISSKTRSLLARVLLGMAFAITGTLTQAQTTPAEVQAYFDGLHTLKGSFTQVVFDAKGQQIENSSGTLQLAKPSKAHWDYTSPYRQQLISNGQSVWLYDMDLSQVTVRDMSEFTGQLPTSLLTGAVPISSDFNIDRVGNLSDAIQRWSLTPKKSGGEYKSMMLGFSAGQLTRIEVVNHQDQLTMLNLSGVQENAGVNTEIFDFTPPAGVDVFQ